MKVLVTGAGGHVGGAIVQHLASTGHEVIALVHRAKGVFPAGTCVKVMDIDGELTGLDTGAEAVNAIVHAAALVEDSLPSEKLIRTNVCGTKSLLQYAREKGVSSFLYISSLSLLGIPCRHPVTESHPLCPASLYALTKLAAESMVIQAAEEGWGRGISFRISSPIGPGLRRKRIFSSFVQASLFNQEILLHGKGGRRQDYVDVRDVARAVADVLPAEVAGIFNIASGVATSNAALAHVCVRTLNSASPIRFSGAEDASDSHCWDVSIAKARAAFDYEPHIKLDQSITDYVTWLRQSDDLIGGLL